MDKEALREIAIAFVLRHEGGYVNDPRDPGGETKFGISKRSYPDLDIKDLTREEAARIYARDWWAPGRFDDIAEAAGPLVAVRLFDLAVNMGMRTAFRLFQEAIRDCGEAIATDGIVGPKTLAAASRVDRWRLAFHLLRRAAARYARLPQRAFLAGWIRRLTDIPEGMEAA